MRIIALVLLLFAVAYEGHLSRYDLHRQYRPSPFSKYRISPKTGVRIALPTPDQLEWQAREIGIIIHFNMATYIMLDGCHGQIVPNISLFNPYLLNTDNWVQSIVDLGAKSAVLVAKHTCGFHMAPTDVKFALNPSGEVIPYNYSIGYSPVKGMDVLGSFVSSCQQKEVKTGFYYTAINNNWFNVNSGIVQNRTLAPGQLNITQETYNNIVFQHLEEIWTRYGNLSEIWFDGGYTSAMRDPITKLLKNLQPHAIVFNGYGITPNPVRWIGNEAGFAPDPNWSTGIWHDGGNPNSTVFCPAECDTTLQSGIRWFWGPNVRLRSLEELIEVYHRTVGRNCLLMLDLTPDQRGLIPSDYAQRYKELGDFIRTCYGSSAVPRKRLTLDDSHIHLQFFDSSPVTVDRSMIQEDQTNGQVVREYTIDVQLVDSTNSTQWITVANGTSIGNKKIDLWQAGPQLINAARLTITKSVDTPVIKLFSLHLCS